MVSDDSDFHQNSRLKSRHHRASSAERESKEFLRERFSPDETGLLKLNYPLLPYYMNGATSDSEDSIMFYKQEEAHRMYSRTLSERRAEVCK